MKEADVDIIEAPFTLKSNVGGSMPLHGLCLWFDTQFDGTTAAAEAGDDDLPPLESAAAPAVEDALFTLSTSPADVPTHWAQTLFLLETPLNTPSDGVVSGSITMARDGANPREYRFIIKLGGRTLNYHMS